MRLKLDLGDFVDDERRLSLLCVKTGPGECMTVGDVIIKICQVFSVGPKEGDKKSYAEVALFDDGFFIHPSQCSSVLEEGGLLKLQRVRSQEVVKKKKKKTNIDDIELIEINKSNKEENKNEFENVKAKRKNQILENKSVHEKEADLESLRKKQKHKLQNSESESNNKNKKPLEVKLNILTEYSKSSKKKRKIIKNEMNDVNEDKKEYVKTSKRIKNLSQELIEQENATVVENNESSSDEITIVESLKGEKSRLKRKADKELIDTEESLTQACIENVKKVDINHKKTDKEQKIDNSEKNDSEDNQFDPYSIFFENGKKRRRRRKRKKKTMNCLEQADSVTQYPDTSVNNNLVPNTKLTSDNSRKTIETQMYNFNYSKPRNKKPMAKGIIPQNTHVIFDSDDIKLEKSIISIDDNVNKESLSSSLWDLSDINIVNNSINEVNSPSTSTPIIPPIDVKVENSCSEISSTSMQKFLIPNRIKKVNSTEENEKTFGALLQLSKSEEPLICTYAGQNVKEKSNNYKNIVTSATDQHQRRSPPKSTPTHLPQDEEVANVFHNLLATQNFPQAFICPRTPSISKLTCVKKITNQPVISSTDIASSNESIINTQQNMVNSVANDIRNFHKSNDEAVDGLENNDGQEKELESEMNDMVEFTKVTVEANLAEAKAAISRRKRARPKAVSSIGSLLNRIRAGGLNPKEETKSNIEDPSNEIKDNIGRKITNTIDCNELELSEFNSDSSAVISNLHATDEILKRGEQNVLRSIDKEANLLLENLRQLECNVPENCDIKTANNQKNIMDLNNDPELIQRDEVNDVEEDIEVREVKDSDCLIVNTLSESGSPNRKGQLHSGGPHGSKSPIVARNTIKTVITVRDEESPVITVKDEDSASTSIIKETKSYKELGEAFFDQFPVMKSLPKVKEFVAVKLLSLDENCIPVYSNYQQAQVLKVQGTSITLRYIDKLEKLPSKDGQAQVVDLTLEGNGNTETIDWRDVHEPRLIFP